jgi:hypothetical protein
MRKLRYQHPCLALAGGIDSGHVELLIGRLQRLPAPQDLLRIAKGREIFPAFGCGGRSRGKPPSRMERESRIQFALDRGVDDLARIGLDHRTQPREFSR